jgi:hypothetical protein
MSKFERYERHPLSKRLQATLTRPANTTQYAAGDIIANSDAAPVVNVLAGASLANGRGGKIRSVTLIDSSNALTAGDFELWLLNAAYTATNDNAAFAPTDAEAATVEAIISLPGSGSIIGNAGADAAGNRIYQVKDIDKDFTCAAASKNLWWVLIARNAYTPVSAEAFTLKLDIEQR